MCGAQNPLCWAIAWKPQVRQAGAASYAGAASDAAVSRDGAGAWKARARTAEQGAEPRTSPRVERFD